MSNMAMLRLTYPAYGAQATSHLRPSLGGLRSLFAMYELDAARYHNAVLILANVISMADGRNRPPQNEQMPPESVNASVAMLDRFSEAIEVLHVPVTKLTVADTKGHLQNDGLNFFQCGELLLTVAHTLRRELQTVKVFSLDDNRAAFYSPVEPLFGLEVRDRFPSAVYEIDQGGKCYACDLTTAAAFHWIRSLEAGIRAMARCLHIPDPTTGRERNWGQLNIAFRDQIETNWPKATGRMGGDAHLFDRLYGSISGMQNPYRNETMHLSAKYTAPEALHIFELVKGLMTQIAARMDEEGNPKI